MKLFNLEEYLANPNKKVVTRDGRSVKIYCTNNSFVPYPIIAKVEGEDCPWTFNENGNHRIHSDSIDDLFFAPEKKVGWVNILRGKDGPLAGNVIFTSKEEAEESSRHFCGFTKDLYLTTAKIEWEE